jgi:hypothetical protein
MEFPGDRSEARGTRGEGERGRGEELSDVTLYREADPGVFHGSQTIVPTGLI